MPRRAERDWCASVRRAWGAQIRNSRKTVERMESRGRTPGIGSSMGARIIAVPPLQALSRLSARRGVWFIIRFHAHFSADCSIPFRRKPDGASHVRTRRGAGRTTTLGSRLSSQRLTNHSASDGEAEAGATEAGWAAGASLVPGHDFSRVSVALPARGDPDEAGGQPGGRPVRANGAEYRNASCGCPSRE